MEIGAHAFVKLFPLHYIPSIFRAILNASRLLYKKTEVDHEDWISRRLYRLLIQAYPFRDGPLDISLQPEIVAVDRDEHTPSGRIDFIVSCGLGARVYFAIEAIRLRVRNEKGHLRTGNSEYVNQGMMRFISGRYSPYTDTGSMLGYVFDGETTKARNGISSYIRRVQQKIKILPPECLARSEVSPNLPIDETRHALPRRIFKIYHIFIPIPTQNSPDDLRTD